MEKEKSGVKYHRLFYILILLLIQSGCVKDGGEGLERAEIVEWGLFQSSGKTMKRNAPYTSSGFVRIDSSMDDPVFLPPEDNIDGKPGIMFGIRFRLDGYPLGKKVFLSIHVTHPPIINPENGNAYRDEYWKMPAVTGMFGCTGWIFDDNWEISNGEWRFQVLHKKKLLAEKVFFIDSQAARNSSIRDSWCLGCNDTPVFRLTDDGGKDNSTRIS